MPSPADAGRSRRSGACRQPYRAGRDGCLQHVAAAARDGHVAAGQPRSGHERACPAATFAAGTNPDRRSRDEWHRAPVGGWRTAMARQLSDDPEVVALATSLRLVLALMQILDGVQSASMGALREFWTPAGRCRRPSMALLAQDDTKLMNELGWTGLDVGPIPSAIAYMPLVITGIDLPFGSPRQALQSRRCASSGFRGILPA